MEHERAHIAGLLRRSMSRGGATERLISVLCEELRAQLRRDLREGQLRRATDLVRACHERLVDPLETNGERLRLLFLSAAGRALRRVLVSLVRSRGRAARELERWREVLADPEGLLGALDLDLVELDHHLKELGRLSRHGERVLELRLFAGLDDAQLARHLGITPATVRSERRIARAWLEKRRTRVARGHRAR